MDGTKLNKYDCTFRINAKLYCIYNLSNVQADGARLFRVVFRGTVLAKWMCTDVRVQAMHIHVTYMSSIRTDNVRLLCVIVQVVGKAESFLVDSSTVIPL